MSKPHAALALLLFLAFFSCGCARKSLVALVPDPDGRTGSIVVTNRAGSVAMDSPYHATTVRDRQEVPSEPKDMGKEKLEEIFAEALSIQPQRPLHFLLYFKEHSTLTVESKKLLPEILAAIEERKSGYVSVVGYTDTMGTHGYNRDVGHDRAVAVAELLVQKGVDPSTLSVTWHGEGALLVPTPDETFERRNRAVEVIVR